jgi:hypothetical protein
MEMMWKKGVVTLSKAFHYDVAQMTSLFQDYLDNPRQFHSAKDLCTNWPRRSVTRGASADDAHSLFSGCDSCPRRVIPCAHDDTATPELYGSLQRVQGPPGLKAMGLLRMRQVRECVRKVSVIVGIRTQIEECDGDCIGLGQSGTDVCQCGTWLCLFVLSD